MNLAVNIYGIYVPALLVFIVGGLALAYLLRRILTAVGFYRFVWHPALFDLAVIVISVGAVFLVFR